MKNRYIIVLLAISVNISCSDLELEPLNSVTPDSFYSNEQNLETGLLGIYSQLQEIGLTDYPSLEGMSDNAISDPGGLAPDVESFAAGQAVVATEAFVRFYSNNFNLIQRANLLLDNIDGIPAITDEDRETIRSEARALRAFSYMKLVYLYGDVPFFTSFLERTEALAVSRTSRGEIIQFVLDEFLAAGNTLNVTPAGEGRLTKQAVLGLRARVMLYEARLGNQSWSDVLSAVNTALTAADNGGNTIINTGNPTADYQSLFTELNENNAEFIFSIKNNFNDLGENYEVFYSWFAGRLKFHVHQNLADAYPYADGSPYNPSDDTYVGRDPRLSANIMHEGLTFRGQVYDGTDEGGFVGGNSLNSVTNLFFHKFITTDYTETFNEGQLDLPVLRYAELLLMQAEARNESGSGDAFEPLNVVRARAGLPALNGLSQTELRDAITLERRLELAMEGLRWFDLITLGIAETTINSIVEESSAIIRNFTPNRNELLPIPQTEIDLNENLSQNPGY